MNMYLDDFLIQELKEVSDHTPSFVNLQHHFAVSGSRRAPGRHLVYLVCLVEFHLSLSVDQTIVILMIRANSEENCLALSRE